jgi:hypothetical protein
MEVAPHSGTDHRMPFGSGAFTTMTSARHNSR